MSQRKTRQKTLIYEAIVGKEHHMTAEEVLKLVQQTDPSIGLATIYRNLNVLVQEHKIQKIVYNGISCYDGNPVPHDHFHCIRCNKYFDYIHIYNEQLDELAGEQLKAKIFSHSTVYEGICSECIKDSEGSDNN